MSEYDAMRSRRFDEAQARAAVDTMIRDIVWHFAALMPADKTRAIAAFNELHDAPERADRYRIVTR